MLLHIGRRNKHVSEIKGDAQVVITIRADGSLLMSGYLLGDWNTTYADSSNAVLDKVPGLIAELRAELREQIQSLAVAETAQGM